MSGLDSTVTQLLNDWSNGDPEALIKLIPLVIADLRSIARRQLARERQASTLQTTALVNEVYLRLAKKKTVHWKNSQHFFASMAGIIRRILVDHARLRKADKRGGGIRAVPLDFLRNATDSDDPDLLALDLALESYAQEEPRRSLVIHLHFFVGLTMEEIGEILGVSARTAKREWKLARLALHEKLSA